MNDDNLLEIMEKYKWIMPNMEAYKREKEEREKRKQEILVEKQERKQRKNNKIKIEGYVIEAMSKGYNTFGKIKNNIPSDIENKDIKSAISRLINKNKVIKVTRRIYKLT